MFQGIDIKSLVWWYWLATVIAIMVGLIYSSVGFLFAMALTIWQGVHLAIKQGHVFAFSVQVRFWYLLFLTFAYLANFQFMFVSMTIATWAQIILGYCIMARFVALHPWNLNQPLSLGLVKEIVFSAPKSGSIQQRLSPIQQDDNQ